MNLKDFNDIILKPSLLKSIKAGRLDSSIQDIDCQDIIEADPELKKAAQDRMEKLK